MAFAIMRCAKKSSMGAVARSLKHCFRELPTPNADPSRTPQNSSAGSRSTDEAMGQLRQLLPEKRRKDAVLVVEYLMTASPEWWKEATPEQQKAFFRHADQWLIEKYGKDNIIASVIHRDETSPHLSAFVVPLTADKRLSAKEFIGNKTKMSEDQTTFADKVKDLGLQRGIKGSKAKHQTIREYYALANSALTPKTPEIDVPEPKLLESKAAYGNRVAQATIDAINPALQQLSVQASTAKKRIEAAEREKAAAEARAVDAKNLANAAQLSRKNTQDEVEKLHAALLKAQNLIREGGEPLKRIQEQLKEREAQRQQPERGRGMGR